MKQEQKDKPEDKKPKDSTVKIKQSELDELNSRLNEATDSAKRILAEYDNFKKRCEKEKEQFCQYSNAGMISKLLPFIDSLEQAMKNNPDEGVKQLFNQLISILEKEGLRPIECLGKSCDTNYHDILMQEESDKPEGTILEELQKGYMFKDKVLRHCKVKIAKQKENVNADVEKEKNDSTPEKKEANQDG